MNGPCSTNVISPLFNSYDLQYNCPRLLALLVIYLPLPT